MAEPVRKLFAPAAAPPPRRRAALYADVLPPQPITAAAPRRRDRTLLDELVSTAVLAGFIALAIFLWCA